MQAWERREGSFKIISFTIKSFDNIESNRSTHNQRTCFWSGRTLIWVDILSPSLSGYFTTFLMASGCFNFSGLLRLGANALAPVNPSSFSFWSSSHARWLYLYFEDAYSSRNNLITNMADYYSLLNTSRTYTYITGDLKLFHNTLSARWKGAETHLISYNSLKSRDIRGRNE